MYVETVRRVADYCRKLTAIKWENDTKSCLTLILFLKTATKLMNVGNSAGALNT